MCNALVWSWEFPDEFKRRKGYDITPHLYKLIRLGHESGRIRCDYFDVLAYLYQENYFGRLQKWCHTHDVELYAHLLGEETLFGHVKYSGDYMRQSRFQDQVGSDHLGKGIGSLNVKFTSSSAHSYGKDSTAIELFAGCGWGLTFEEYIRIVTWSFQQGMKIVCNHGFFYSDRDERKNDWPPSQFFQWQGWDRMKEANVMTRRLHYALTGGITEADILVYNPIETLWLHYIPDQHFTHAFYQGPYLKSEQAAKLDHEYQLLLNGLSSENLDFEIIHKDAVDNFKVEQGKIINHLNGQAFSVLILPMCEVLPYEAAELCYDFIHSGGTVIALNTIPTMSMPRKKDKKLNDIFDSILSNERFIMLDIQDKIRLFNSLRNVIPSPIWISKGTKGTTNNHPVYPDFLIDPYMHDGEDISGVLFTRYIKDGYRNTLITNYSDIPETIQIDVVTDEVPEIWDTFTGEISAANVVSKQDNIFKVELALPCNYGIVLVSKVIGRWLQI